MCGFVIGNIFKDKKEFCESLNYITHRGQDSQGIHQDLDTFIGHNRLSIQGLNTESNQPMFLDSKVLVYNGELWKSMDVFKNDYDLHTGSDTELLLNMLITEKEECINKLDLSLIHI